MTRFQDQTGYAVEIGEVPQRIVSLVPSQTEFLYHLGLEERIVGTTWFCIHPKELVKSSSRIGGTKQVNFEKIAALKPDLIIANKEENTREEIEALRNHYPVWTSDINNLKEAFSMMLSLGEITGMMNQAQSLVRNIKEQWEPIKTLSSGKALYLIWYKPWMAAGKMTFISHVLEYLGIDLVEIPARYPELNVDQIKALLPDWVFYSSEPFPFKEVHMNELKECLPNAKHVLVDGEMFSWYGSRLLESPSYFRNLFD